MIIGAGAIGGTIGAHMVRAGHEITFCDLDNDHVDAMNRDGLCIEGPVENFNVKVNAITPDQMPSSIKHVAIAVKSHHTSSAVALIKNRLDPDGFVVTFQNGFTSKEISEEVGNDRVIASFVNFGADYLSPGRIIQGNIGCFRVGEISINKITPRIEELAQALPYAKSTANILGYLWSKEAYGAMLYAGATSELSIADTLEIPKYRSLMLGIAREVLAQAPTATEKFDGFDPDDLEGSLNRLVLFNRASAKTHSGIYRDLTIRKRKTEVDDLLRDLSGPLTKFIGEIIQSIERGERICEVANLDLLATYERALRLNPDLNAIVKIFSAPRRSRTGPLHNLQIAVKDIINISGHPRGNGNPIDSVAAPANMDAPIIRRLRDLGADIFAAAQLLEYAAGATNPDIPETMNPYNFQRTAGGSSGGSAAIVGSGICDIAIGTDTGGSIRIPAHYCGIVGFKPTYNSFSLDGVTPLATTFDHVGLLAKDVDSTTQVFSAVMSIPNQLESVSLDGLRVGFITSQLDLPELATDISTSIVKLLRRLKQVGVKVLKINGKPFEEIETTFGDILMYEAWRVHGEQFGKNPLHFGHETRRFIEASKNITKKSYEIALGKRLQLLPNVAKIYASIDVLLTIAAPFVAPSTTPPVDTPEGVAEGAYTSIFNITGDPAIVLPYTKSKEGLPIGFQLSTAINTDMKLLAIAKAIENLISS